jgi:hypothetical protein
MTIFLRDSRHSRWLKFTYKTGPSCHVFTLPCDVHSCSYATSHSLSSNKKNKGAFKFFQEMNPFRCDAGPHRFLKKKPRTHVYPNKLRWSWHIFSDFCVNTINIDNRIRRGQVHIFTYQNSQEMKDSRIVNSSSFRSPVPFLFRKGNLASWSMTDFTKRNSYQLPKL